MKGYAPIAAVAALALAAPVAAQSAAVDDAPAGLRAELIADIAGLGEKYVSLARAMPAESYDWSPGEGVRSTAEVFEHIANANYFIAGAAGVEGPRGILQPDAQHSKDDLIGALTRSFADAQAAVGSVSDATLDDTVQLFGSDTTRRNVLLLLVNHMHEHLGQIIAYARTNGVVPPWSAGE